MIPKLMPKSRKCRLGWPGWRKGSIATTFWDVREENHLEENSERLPRGPSPIETYPAGPREGSPPYLAAEPPKVPGRACNVRTGTRENPCFPRVRSRFRCYRSSLFRAFLLHLILGRVFGIFSVHLGLLWGSVLRFLGCLGVRLGILPVSSGVPCGPPGTISAV